MHDAHERSRRAYFGGEGIAGSLAYAYVAAS